jgi:beta-fructofuranosidase
VLLAVSRLNEKGRSDDDGSDATAYNIIGMGTEQGRNGSHENHWPIWLAGTFSVESNGSVTSSVDFAGVIDWGRAYAFVNFPYDSSREITIGWTYEDDENLTLATQRGYQGAFTLFRDLFMLVIPNVHPSTPGLHDPGNWGVRNESDGSISIVTVGQRVVPEITKAYRSSSTVYTEKPRVFNSTIGVVPFVKKPRDAHYAVTGTFRLKGDAVDLPSVVGFRVLSGTSEWTDVYYDAKNETIVVDRSHSTLITSYGADNEYGKLRLWSVKDSSGGYARQDLNLSVYGKLERILGQSDC